MFGGFDHLSLSVTDVDVSQRFYTEVLEFFFVTDFGLEDVRFLIHRESGFCLTLLRHSGASSDPFTELNTGLDHIGFVVTSREELVAWEERFQAAGVTFTPIRDMPTGHHLNFRDPDNIPLEFVVSSPALLAAMQVLQDREPSREEIEARLAELLAMEPVSG